MVRRHNYGMRTNLCTMTHSQATAAMHNRVSINTALRTYFNRAVKCSHNDPAIDIGIRSNYNFRAPWLKNSRRVN